MESVIKNNSYDFIMLDEADATFKACAILVNPSMQVYGLCDLKLKPFIMLSATFSDTETQTLKIGLGLESD